MTNDTLQIMAAFVGAAGIGLGLVSLLVTLTLAFSRVTAIEQEISGTDTSILAHRKIWGTGPLGRLMRSSYVFTFLILRAMPSSRLKKSAAQMGDVTTKLPARLELWGLVPPLCMYTCVAVVVVCGALIKTG